MTVIDRFEDNIAVLEADGEMVEIPREKLPAEAREGDILNFADGIYTIDEKAVVVVTSKDGTKKERYPLKTGDDTLLVMLDEGDTIEVQSEDDPNACIYLMEWVN